MRPKPDLRDPEYLAYAHLFNDITFTDHGEGRGPLFSTRQRIADHLWELGYRKPLCSYENRWTDEVGTIPVCVVHGNNSRHVDSDDPHRPCLTVDPYPLDEEAGA